MTKPTELRELPEEELTARLDSAREELFNLRFQLATGQLDNPMRIKQLRHEIARLFTLLRERELEGAPEQAAAPRPRRRLRRRPEPEAPEEEGPGDEEEEAS